MNTTEILKELMRLRGFTNITLAGKLGRSTPSSISNAIYRQHGMRIDTLVELAGALDCDVVIRSKLRDATEWVVEEK